MNYYLDIETTGLNPFEHKIITIQYMELERNTAKPTGPLKILKNGNLTRRQFSQSSYQIQA